LKRQNLLWAVLFALLLTLFVLPHIPYTQAQSNPTSQRLTLNAIINPRLTLTARGIAARTATAGAQQTATGIASIAAGISTFSAHLTETLIALTNTATPTPTPTATLSLTASVSPMPSVTLTPSMTLNATDEFATIIANVNQLFTATAQAALNATGTAAFRQTVDAVLYATLGITQTPTFTPTPVGGAIINPTNQVETLVADANKRITMTISAQQTSGFQKTIDAIIAATLQLTPTLTLGPTQLQLTFEAQINNSLTRTLDASAAQTGTAVFQGTLNALLNQDRTATSAAIQATVTTGLSRITPDNADKLAELRVLKGHTGAVTGVAFNGNSDLIASSSMDSTVRLWNTLTGTEVFQWQGLTDRLRVVFNLEGTRVAASSSDGTIRIYDLITGNEIAVLSGHKGAVNCIRFSADGTLLASAGADRAVKIWDARTGQMLREVGTTREYYSAVNAVAFSPDGLLLAVGGNDALVYLWEVRSGVQIARFRDVHRINDLIFSPDGKALVTVGQSRSVMLYPYNLQGDRLAIFRANLGTFNTVAFSPNGSMVVAGNENGSIWLWSIADGKELIVLQAHAGAVKSLSFSRDGRRIVSGGTDQIIRIWGIDRSLLQ